MLGDRVMPGGIVARVAAALLQAQGLPPPATLAPPARGAGAGAFWERWTARVMAHPWRAVIGVSAVLLILAIPLLSIETGTAGAQPVPQGQRRAGRQRTRLAAARRRHRPGADRRLLRRRRAATAPRSPPSTAGCERRPASPRSRRPPSPRESALIQATPSAGSESDAAVALVERLRDTVVPGSRARAGSRRSTSAAKPPAATTSAPRSAARCGRSSSSSSRSASSS